MSLNISNTLSSSQCYDLAFGMLVNTEESGVIKQQAYADGAGIPTIGVGMNLRSDGNIRAILETVYPGEWTILSQSQQNGLVNSFQAITNQNWTSQSIGQMNADIVSLLNSAPYFFNTSAFSISESQAKTVYDNIIVSFDNELQGWISSIGGHANELLVGHSRERAVLLGLKYNGLLNGAPDANGTIVYDTPSLRTALEVGDRASAWYEIRYRTNGGGDKAGVAKRRFYESQAFGLFGDESSPTPEEKGEVIALLFDGKEPTQAFKQILAYEQLYGSMTYVAISDYNLSSNTIASDKISFGQVFKPMAQEIVQHFSSHSAAASFVASDFTGDLNIGLVHEFSGEAATLQPEYRHRLGWSDPHENTLPSGVTGINDILIAVGNTGVIGQGLWGDDLLVGSAGADTLYGGYADDLTTFNSGADILIGNEGSDRLFGQDGDDTLVGGVGDDYISGGLGVDTLEAGPGFDVLEGGALNDAYLLQQGDGVNLIKDDEGTIFINGQQLLSLTPIAETVTGALEQSPGYYQTNLGQTAISSGGSTYVFAPGNTSDMLIIDDPSSGTVAPIGLSTASTVFDHSGDVQVGWWTWEYWNPTDGGYYDAWTPPDYQHRAVHENYSWMNSTSLAVHMAHESPVYLGRNPSSPNFFNAWQSNLGSMDGSDVDDVFYGSFGFAGTTYRDYVRDGNIISIESAVMPSELLRGKDGNDTMFGDAERLITYFSNGSTGTVYDTIGDYSLVAGTSITRLGGDILAGGRGSDIIYGQQDDDLIFGMDEYRAPYMLYHNDTYAYAVWDPSWGDDLSDYSLNSLESVGDTDYLNGGSGDDEIYAGSYNDVILGEDGHDRIRAGAGSDVILGGEGNDSIFADSYLKFQSLSGLSYPNAANNPSHSEYISYENSIVYSSDFVNHMEIDKTYDDFIDAGDGDDFVLGELGSDTILGGLGPTFW